MTFSLYTVYNNHKIKKWQPNQRKIANIITSARIILLPTVWYEDRNIYPSPASAIIKTFKFLNFFAKELLQYERYFYIYISTSSQCIHILNEISCSLNIFKLFIKILYQSILINKQLKSKKITFFSPFR